ncbi:MAG: hypothetical protein IH586_06800 [Anaerolineaceae bacterium]|nr:hypothetical protein [Anaerolineaceae bacterium]
MLIIRNVVFISAGIIAAVGLLGWIGLKIKPKSFPVYPDKTPQMKTAPLPAGLPVPVDRFYRTVYGEEIPVIETVVIHGRGVMKPFMNIPMPTRFVFVHDAGKDYRHYFEATLFGIPLMKVDEGYIDGASFFEGPMGTYSNEVNANQGANLALWAEAVWFPSLWVTDPRARWEPVDKHSALLFIPFEKTEESFLVRFDPQTGLIDMMEAMRYRELGQGQPKILWIVRTEEGQPVAGTKISSVGSAMWLDQGKPWAYFNLEEVIYNVDVSEYIRQRGY